MKARVRHDSLRIRQLPAVELLPERGETGDRRSARLGLHDALWKAEPHRVPCDEDEHEDEGHNPGGVRLSARERCPDQEREPDAEVVDDALVVERHVRPPELADDDARDRERRNGEQGRVAAQASRREHEHHGDERHHEERQAVVALERGAVEPVRTEEPVAHRPPERATLEPEVPDDSGPQHARDHGRVQERSHDPVAPPVAQGTSRISPVADEPGDHVDEQRSDEDRGDDDRARGVGGGDADQSHGQEEHVPPTAPAAEQQPERQDHEGHEEHRQRRPETMPVHRIEPDRRDRVRDRGDQARTGAPQHCRGRVHAQRRQRGDDHEADRERPRRDAVEQEDAAVGRPDRRRVGEDSPVLARERIVDQQVALRGYLVGVEEVVAPVRSTRLERVRDVPGRGEREPHDPREGEKREQLAPRRRRPIASYSLERGGRDGDRHDEGGHYERDRGGAERDAEE